MKHPDDRITTIGKITALIIVLANFGATFSHALSDGWVPATVYALITTTIICGAVYAVIGIAMRVLHFPGTPTFFFRPLKDKVVEILWKGELPVSELWAIKNNVLSVAVVRLKNGKLRFVILDESIF